MDVNFKRQETTTNLMATYWQPIDLAWKYLTW